MWLRLILTAQITASLSRKKRTQVTLIAHIHTQTDRVICPVHGKRVRWSLLVAEKVKLNEGGKVNCNLLQIFILSCNVLMSWLMLCNWRRIHSTHLESTVNYVHWQGDTEKGKWNRRSSRLKQKWNHMINQSHFDESIFAISVNHRQSVSSCNIIHLHSHEGAEKQYWRLVSQRCDSLTLRDCITINMSERRRNIVSRWGKRKCFYLL